MNYLWLTPVISFAAFALVMAFLIFTETSKMQIFVAGGLGLIWLGRTLPFRWLLIVLVWTLGLGSCYNWRLSQSSFYIRFVFLSIVVVRGFLSQSTATGQWAEKRSRVPVMPWIFTLICAFSLVTTINSVDTELSLKRFISFVLMTLCLLVTFRLEEKGERSPENLSEALCFSYISILFLGWIFLVIGMPGMHVEGRLRLVLGNANQLGHMCALVFPLLTWKAFKEDSHAIYKVILLLVGASLFFSGSRGGVLAAFIPLLLQYAVCYRKYVFRLFLVGILTGSAILIFKPIEPSAAADQQVSYVEDTLFRKNTLDTGSGRAGVWKSAWRLIKQRPLMGFGFAVTEELFARGYFEEIPLEFQGGHVHNSYLEELVNQGWIGSSMIFMTLLLCHFWGIRFIMKIRSYPQHAKLGVALYATIFAATISAFFESWLTSVGNVMCIPFWLSILMFYKIQSDTQKTQSA